MQETYQTGVILTQREREVVESHAQKLGLGERGFSAALRIIVREWAEQNGKSPRPAEAQNTSATEANK